MARQLPVLECSDYGHEYVQKGHMRDCPDCGSTDVETIGYEELGELEDDDSEDAPIVGSGIWDDIDDDDDENWNDGDWEDEDEDEDEDDGDEE